MFFGHLKFQRVLLTHIHICIAFNYRDSADSNTSVQLTSEGVEDVVYCGIPDWVYEGIIQSLDFFELDFLNINYAIIPTIESNKF